MKHTLTMDMRGSTKRKTTEKPNPVVPALNAPNATTLPYNKSCAKCTPSSIKTRKLEAEDNDDWRPALKGVWVVLHFGPKHKSLGSSTRSHNNAKLWKWLHVGWGSGQF
ncbi:hypothetical protein Pyn_31345 [Prunus yedoensis var. nudiflora]|uniref:Uncharacterized protein n=1 Tax=Prunus yedoensis var. nudiflora TaxID=2094558 RepID=A0A314YRV1_PRUYE|nr:hypothetical protein Pyn_31345 [Prunus yedoensis var. nudiflora]